jgi:hypothetical protein
MLTRKDKDWIRKVIREEFHEALFREITVEKCARKPGDVEKHYETENLNVLDFLARYLPNIEGAIRGMQEDTDRAKNKSIDTNNLINAMSQILIGYEGSIKKLAQFIQVLDGNKFLLPQQDEPMVIECKPDEQSDT